VTRSALQERLLATQGTLYLTLEVPYHNNFSTRNPSDVLRLIWRYTRKTLPTALKILSAIRKPPYNLRSISAISCAHFEDNPAVNSKIPAAFSFKSLSTLLSPRTIDMSNPRLIPFGKRNYPRHSKSLQDTPARYSRRRRIIIRHFASSFKSLVKLSLQQKLTITTSLHKAISRIF
jgi:hypothetical protein